MIAIASTGRSKRTEQNLTVYIDKYEAEVTTVETDTKHRAASLRQQRFLLRWVHIGANRYFSQIVDNNTLSIREMNEWSKIGFFSPFSRSKAFARNVPLGPRKLKLENLLHRRGRD